MYIVTANVNLQANWIVQQLGIGSLITDVIGYPGIPKTEEEREVTKKTILEERMSAHECKSAQAVLIGDGHSDIKFGNQAGVFTIGVINNPENRIKLENENPDLLVKRTAVLLQMRDLLFP